MCPCDRGHVRVRWFTTVDNDTEDDDDPGGMAQRPSQKPGVSLAVPPRSGCGRSSGQWLHDDGAFKTCDDTRVLFETPWEADFGRGKTTLMVLSPIHWPLLRTAWNRATGGGGGDFRGTLI